MRIFDIIVPTFNRYQELPVFFKKMARLDMSKYDLWLIDDCSPEIDESVVPSWPNLHYIKLTENIGQAGARNKAIELGCAPFIISLDDDAWFEESEVFAKIEKAFSMYLDVGCLMFNIATPLTPYNNLPDGLEIPFHITCGCVYRREALLVVGGFSSILQGQAEETDISLKLIKSGYSIRSLYSVKVFHNFNPNIRSEDWYVKIRYKNTRNDLAIAYIHYPFSRAILYVPGKALSHLKFAFTNKIAPLRTAGITIKAWFAFLRWIPRLKREPMSLEKFKSWYRLVMK